MCMCEAVRKTAEDYGEETAVKRQHLEGVRERERDRQVNLNLSIPWEVGSK